VKGGVSLEQSYGFSPFIGDPVSPCTAHRAIISQRMSKERNPDLAGVPYEEYAYVCNATRSDPSDYEPIHKQRLSRSFPPLFSAGRFSSPTLEISAIAHAQGTSFAPRLLLVLLHLLLSEDKAMTSTSGNLEWLVLGHDLSVFEMQVSEYIP
jgi:hypothetical protein